MSSRQEPRGEREALELARKARRLVAARGTSVRELDLTKSPAREDLLALLLGPTGKLRAPTFTIGDTLYVGFPREGFAELR